MNKIYYLKSCDTCKKIMKQIENINDFELQDIKSEPITEAQLEEMYQHTKSYEKLLNKRAQLYKERQLKDKNLTENDIKNLKVTQKKKKSKKKLTKKKKVRKNFEQTFLIGKKKKN